MTEPKITQEEIEALLKLADAATPGPWSTDTIENQEGKGSFNSYAVGAGPSDKWKVVCDTLNSDLIEVEEEYDENGRSSWDEVGRRNAAFIAAANPATLKALCTLALQAEAMQPRPIEEAKGDDYWKALAFATGSWRVAIWNPNTKKFDDDAYGYELQATDFIPLTSLPEPRR